MSADLRVASFNVRTGVGTDWWRSWPFRSRAAREVLRGIDADVIGLQEAYRFQWRSLVRALDGYGATGEGRSARRRSEHCTVLWRRSRLTMVDTDTRWYGPDPHRAGSRLPGATHPRIATITTMRVDEGGATFTFANTHLDQRRPENRLASAEQLLGWLTEEDRPAIVVGDLNTEPGSDVLRAFEAGGLRSALPDDAPGTNHDFTGRLDGARLDHILVSPHWEVTAAEVVTERPRGRLASDHWPVTADLRLA